MLKLWFRLQLYICVCGMLLLQGCSHLPSNIALPEFSTLTTIPLYDSTLTLNDFIGNDTTFLRKDSQGNLFIEETRAIAPIAIGDSLRIDAQNISYSTTLNNQTGILNSVETLGSVTTPIQTLFAGLGLNLPLSGTIPIFPGTPDVGVGLAPIAIQWNDALRYVILESGTFIVRVTNQLPIDITLRPASGQTLPGLLVNTGFSIIYLTIPANQALIPANGTTTLSLNVPSGTRFQAGMTIQAQFFAGPATNLTYTQQNGLVFTFSLQNVRIQEADVDVAPLALTFPITLPLGNGVRLTGARLRNVVASMNLNNGFPLGGTAVITLPQLINTNTNQPFTQQLSIRPSQNNQALVVQTPIGQTFDLRPTSNDANGIMDSVRLQLTTSIPQTRAIIRGSNTVAISGSLARTQLLSAQGVSLRNLSISTRSLVNFTLSEQVNRFRFTNLGLQSSQIGLTISNGTGISANLSGNARFLAGNGTTMDNLPIPLQGIRPGTRNGSLSTPAITEITVAQRGPNFAEIPRQAEFTATVVPRDTAFSVASTDSISGSARIRIPVFMRVLGGTYSNTFSVNLSDLQSASNNIDSASIRLEILNRIPASASLVFRFINAGGQTILTLPQTGVVTVLAPPVTNSRPTSPQFSSISLAVPKESIPALLQAQRCTVEIQINTPGSASNQFVQFLTSDYVQVKAQLRVALNTKQ